VLPQNTLDDHRAAGTLSLHQLSALPGVASTFAWNNSTAACVPPASARRRPSGRPNCSANPPGSGAHRTPTPPPCGCTRGFQSR
jgi:hypothetical protein